MFRLLSAWVLLALTVVIGCNRDGTKVVADKPVPSKDGKPAAQVDTGPAISITALDLYKEWKADKAATNKKYKGKTLEIEGKLKSMMFVNDRTMFGMDVGELTSQVTAVTTDATGFKKAVPPQKVKAKGRYDENGFLGPQITDAEITSGEPTAAKEIAAKDLAQEYEKDPRATKEKRKGQWLIVSGEIAKKSKNEAGAPTFRLKGTDKTFVIASFTANESALFNELKEGQTIQVIGEVTDFNHEDDAFALFMSHLVKK